ncbi:unnamed protein product, partial [Phaeothamnion confervicola]
AVAEAPALPSPFATQTEYHDGFFDLLWIRLVAQRISAAVGAGGAVPEPITYDSYVQLAWGLQRGPPEQQRAAVLTVLRSLVPSLFVMAYRLLSPLARRPVAELSAVMCPPFSKWLVGPAAATTAEVTLPDGRVETWRSAVKVERCRYLEASRCKGACMNLCKVPTETFFAEELGMPLRMTPNFDDLSCEFAFGHAPLPRDEDPQLKDPCYKECPAAATSFV